MRNNLLKSWNDKQNQFVENAIVNYFKQNNPSLRHIFDMRGCNPFDYLDNYLGLAFTSSSAFAALWVCNVHYPLHQNPNYIIRGFALNDKNEVIIYCLDDEENELFYNTEMRLFS